MAFIPDPLAKKVSLPVRITKDGQITFLYGGALPQIRETAGELIVPAASVGDTDLLNALENEEEHTFFSKGTTLLVAVNPEKVPADLSKALSAALKGTMAAVEVVCKEDQVIRVRCTKHSELAECLYSIPALSATAQSLNEAYRLISEKLEPHRRSHSGNVFQKVLYWNKAGHFVPIDELRKELEAQAISVLAAMAQQWWWNPEEKAWAVHCGGAGAMTLVTIFSPEGKVSGQIAHKDGAAAEKWLIHNGHQVRSPGHKVPRPRPPYRDYMEQPVNIVPSERPTKPEEGYRNALR